MFSWDVVDPSRGNRRTEYDLRPRHVREREDPQPEQRTWFDRVLAPFEAPQQFLFSLTKEVADDGFQFGDVSTAFAHAARYFNPFSDQERISESEIADVFFGEGRNREGVGNFFTNLGISLLYDPLWFAGAAKLARAPTAAVRAIDMVTNPAGVALEGIAAVGRTGGILAAQLGEKALGDTRWGSLSYRIASFLAPPSKLIDPEAMESINKVQTMVQEYQMRAAPIARYVQEVGPEADVMLRKGLTNVEIGNALELGEKATAGQRKALQQFTQELRNRGLDPDRYFETFQTYRNLNHEFESELIRLGVISGAAGRELHNRYLRNSINFKQSPVDMQRRLDQLISRTEGKPEFAHLYESRKVFQEVKLRESLEKLAADLRDVTTEAGRAFQSENILRSSVRREFFPGVPGSPKERTFNVDAFMPKFREYINANPRHSISEALEFIQKDMFGGVPMPTSFKEVISNYLVEGMVDTQTIPQWQEFLAQGRAMGSVKFRQFAQNADVVKDRHAIPDEIMQEVLGVSPHAVTSIADEISTSSRQVAIGRMFDDLSGAVRLDPNDVTRIRETSSTAFNRFGRSAEGSVAMSANAEAALKQFRESPDFRNMVRDMAEDISAKYPHLDADEAQRLVNRIIDGSVGANDVVGYVDGFARVPAPRTPGMASEIERGWVRVPDSDSWGSLAGLEVPEFVFRHLSQYQRIIQNPHGMSADSMGHAILDWMAGTTSAFKFMKIAADVGAHVRDALGSVIQMDIMGMMPFKISNWKRASQAVLRSQAGEIDEYVQIAHDVGFNIFGSTLAGTELGRAAARAVGNAPTGPKIDWLDDTTKVFSRVLDGVSRIGERAANAYQTRESVIRSYAFITKYDEIIEGVARAGGEITRDVQLNAARQAADFTTRALFNYADVSVAVEFARRTGLAPFLTFPTKAAGQMVDVLYNNPWQILKYDRTIDAWNDHWADGDLGFAQEIQNLRPDIRENLVVRLPWENRDGDPLYIDLSYFLPWSAVRDLASDVSGLFSPLRGLDVDEGGGEGDDPQVRGSYPGASAGGGMFTPVFTQLISPILTGKDGLGREIFTETSSSSEKRAAIAKHLYQFFAPPTFFGGSTAETVGRAIAAAARTSSEPVDWVEYLGLGMGAWMSQDTILNRYGEGPSSRALPTMTENPVGQAALGIAGLFAPVSVADADRAARNEALGASAFVSQVESEMTRIAENPYLSDETKEQRIARLRALIEDRIQRNREWRQFVGW